MVARYTLALALPLVLHTASAKAAFVAADVQAESFTITDPIDSVTIRMGVAPFDPNLGTLTAAHLAAGWGAASLEAGS